MKFKTVIAFAAILAGSCSLQPASAQLRLNPNSTWLYPPGYLQYLDSKSDDATFTKMDTIANGLAGYSYIWINGIPFLVPVYFPHQQYVQQKFPWYNYDPTMSTPCAMQPFHCR